jgi:hypothetical protein
MNPQTTQIRRSVPGAVATGWFFRVLDSEVVHPPATAGGNDKNPVGTASGSDFSDK